MRNLNLKYLMFICALLLTLLSMETSAESTPVDVDVTVSLIPMVTTKPEIIVPKQTLYLDVTLWTTTWFTKPPQFPEWNIKDAIILPSTEQSYSLSRNKGGQTWAGVHRRFIIIPQQDKIFVQQPQQIVLQPAQINQPLSVMTPIISFTATMPKNASTATLSDFIPSADLQLTQTIKIISANNQSDAETIKRAENNSSDSERSGSLSDAQLNGTNAIKLSVGDGIERTITITAPQLLSNYLPPWQLTVPDGLSIYQQNPQVQNLTKDRGTFTAGQRIDKISYIVQQAGTYHLDPLFISWWDLKSQTMQKATLPALQIVADSSDPHGVEQQLQPKFWQRLLQNSADYITTMVVFFIIILFIFYFNNKILQLFYAIVQWLRQLIYSWIHSEFYYYLKLYYVLSIPLINKKQKIKMYQWWQIVFYQKNRHLQKTPQELQWLQSYYGKSTDKTGLISDHQLRCVIKQQRQFRLKKVNNKYQLPRLNR